MLKLKKVAVTGGLASGKTTVCQMFQELGAYVVSADSIVHQLLSSNTAAAKQIIVQFGTEILSKDGIDRKKLAKVAFSSIELLRKLEEILHPKVFAHIDAIYEEIKEGKRHHLFVAEIPLFYESHCPKTYDAVIAVVADDAVCKERYLKEKEGTASDFERRSRYQFSEKEKAMRADYVIYNNGTLEALREDVRALFGKLTS